MSADQLAKVIARAEAHLDPDGLEPRERDARAERSLRDVRARRHVPLHRQVRRRVRARRSRSRSRPSSPPSSVPRTTTRTADPTPTADLRSLPQRQIDALALIARHVLGCDHNDLPLGGATVVVRMSREDLESGDGHALIDGINQPVSIAAARRMAAGGGIIPCVLGSHGEVLDWGREKRLFTKAQRLALVERDGGCAMCGLPPGMTRAHHIRWWSRDRGPTDLANGVLLCESCHHRIHDNGWDIRIDGVGTEGAGVVHPAPPCRPHPHPTPRRPSAIRLSRRMRSAGAPLVHRGRPGMQPGTNEARTNDAPANEGCPGSRVSDCRGIPCEPELPVLALLTGLGRSGRGRRDRRRRTRGVERPRRRRGDGRGALQR